MDLTHQGVVDGTGYTSSLTNVDINGACSRCVWRGCCLDIFPSSFISLSFLPLRYRLNYSPQRAVKLQTTNQPNLTHQLILLDRYNNYIRSTNYRYLRQIKTGAPLIRHLHLPYRLHSPVRRIPFEVSTGHINCCLF